MSNQLPAPYLLRLVTELLKAVSAIIGTGIHFNYNEEIAPAWSDIDLQESTTASGDYFDLAHQSFQFKFDNS